MEKITVAAISVRNLVGQVDGSIAEMEKWLAKMCGKGAELVLFPELNLHGYIPAEVAGSLAETLPGPSTEKIIALARRYETIISFGMLERQAAQVSCTHVIVSGSGIIGKQGKIHVPPTKKPTGSLAATLLPSTLAKPVSTSPCAATLSSTR